MAGKCTPQGLFSQSYLQNLTPSAPSFMKKMLKYHNVDGQIDFEINLPGVSISTKASYQRAVAKILTKFLERHT